MVSLALGVAGGTAAQTVTATLSGTVRATTGVAVSHAHITAINAATGHETRGETDDSGHYVLSLHPSEYQISVTAQGFVARITKATLKGSEKRTLDVTLDPSPGPGQ